MSDAERELSVFLKQAAIATRVHNYNKLALDPVDLDDVGKEDVETNNPEGAQDAT